MISILGCFEHAFWVAKPRSFGLIGHHLAMLKTGQNQDQKGVFYQFQEF